jgi:hypothetical protein
VLACIAINIVLSMAVRSTGLVSAGHMFMSFVLNLTREIITWAFLLYTLSFVAPPVSHAGQNANSFCAVPFSNGTTPTPPTGSTPRGNCFCLQHPTGYVYRGCIAYQPPGSSCIVECYPNKNSTQRDIVDYPEMYTKIQEGDPLCKQCTRVCILDCQLNKTDHP